MNFTDEALEHLARELGGEAVRSREALEARVTVPIRVALRTGHGRPVLINWVRRNLPAVAPEARQGDQVDPEWAAPRMARLLCSQILQQLRDRLSGAASRETVVA